MNAKKATVLILAAIMIFTCFTGCEKLKIGGKGSNDGGEITPAGDYSEGLAVVQYDGLYGYIDTKGRLVIPAAYSTAESFHDGLAKVSYEKDGVMADLYIDENGNEIIDLSDYADDYRGIYGWGEGLFTARTKSGSVVYLNSEGKKAFVMDESIRLIAENSIGDNRSPSDFHGGFAFVETELGIGRIDKNGVVCETGIYGRVLQTVTNGIALCAAKKNDNYRVAVYDAKKNECVISKESFNKDIVAKYYADERKIVYSSETDGRCGIMNLNAEVVEEFNDCIIGDFASGVATITYADEGEGAFMAYIDSNGIIVKDRQNQYIFGDYNDEGYALWLDADSYKSNNKVVAYVANERFVICSTAITCDAFETIPTFSEGFALVPYRGSYALLGTNGNTLETQSSLKAVYNPEVTPERIPTFSGKVTDYVGVWIAAAVYIYSEDNDMYGELYEISNSEIENGTDVVGALSFKADGSAEYILTVDDVLDEHGQGTLTIIDGDCARIAISEKKALKLISNANDENILYCSTIYYPHEDSALFVLRRDNSVKMPDLSNEGESKILPLVKTHVYSQTEILERLEPLRNEGYSIKGALRIARNELYANYGNVFKDNKLNKYFYEDHADLYAKNPYYDTDDIYSLFNEYEVHNINTIKKLEANYD